MKSSTVDLVESSSAMMPKSGSVAGAGAVSMILAIDSNETVDDVVHFGRTVRFVLIRWTSGCKSEDEAEVSLVLPEGRTAVEQVSALSSSVDLGG